MKTLDTNKEFIGVGEVMEVIKDGTADNVEELKGIIEEVGKNADTFIRESYFSEYIFNLIDEVENPSDRLKGYIDYGRFERDERMNYYEVEIDGISYLTLT